MRKPKEYMLTQYASIVRWDETKSDLSEVALLMNVCDYARPKTSPRIKKIK